MKIVENPNTKLESVDLIDDNGTLLRITAKSLIEIEYCADNRKSYSPIIYKNFCFAPPILESELRFSVNFLGRVLGFHFTGEKADKIAESLYKLK